MRDSRIVLMGMDSFLTTVKKQITKQNGGDGFPKSA
jgi:hypothetical protein